MPEPRIGVPGSLEVGVSPDDEQPQTRTSKTHPTARAAAFRVKEARFINQPFRVRGKDPLPFPYSTLSRNGRGRNRRRNSPVGTGTRHCLCVGVMLIRMASGNAPAGRVG